VQVRATDVGATDFHQGVLRPDLGQGIFPNLQLRAGGWKKQRLSRSWLDLLQFVILFAAHQLSTLCVEFLCAD
jgi:hypothetical protein